MAAGDAWPIDDNGHRPIVSRKGAGCGTAEAVQIVAENADLKSEEN